MRQFRVVTMLAVAASVTFSMLTVPSAQAYKQFYDEFNKKYVAEKSTPEQQKLADAIKKVKKCNVCHDPRKIDGKASKKNRNAYGEAMAKLLTKKDKKDVEKIVKALETVAKQKAPDSDKTFGQLIEAGELPAKLKE